MCWSLNNHSKRVLSARIGAHFTVLMVLGLYITALVICLKGIRWSKPKKICCNWFGSGGLSYVTPTRSRRFCPSLIYSVRHWRWWFLPEAASPHNLQKNLIHLECRGDCMLCAVSSQLAESRRLNVTVITISLILLAGSRTADLLLYPPFRNTSCDSSFETSTLLEIFCILYSAWHYLSTELW